MFEIVKCLREKSIPSVSCAADQTKVEEVEGFQCICCNTLLLIIKILNGLTCKSVIKLVFTVNFRIKSVVVMYEDSTVTTSRYVI